MFDIATPVLWLIGIIALAAAFLLLRGYFSAEARERRRRERSHRPVISTASRPMVRLAAETEKPKDDRKR
jgi:hypothetical protein